MKPPINKKKTSGFSLVETIVATFIMSLVITGGLSGLGQSTLLSEKSRHQSLADFVLRTEVEQLRTMDWNDVEALQGRIETYETNNTGDRYPTLQILSADDLSSMGMSSELKVAQLNSSGETGKLIFHLTLNWEDKINRAHEESRVLIITEGGISAGS